MGVTYEAAGSYTAGLLLLAAIALAALVFTAVAFRGRRAGNRTIAAR